MSPKEKAKELVDKMLNVYPIDDIAIDCALIAVQEILCSNPHSNPLTTEVYSTMLFWNDVKQEIENL